ncbi:PAS domain S-box protein [Sphingobium sufflavum]|uniref:hybrid sensor histidine kinase/response regulator n=1 Tax=Sphingobium sufflavum TaxID=1129547 RepID=UPI001F41279A|nr:PAS domain-containing sensor histidine kinase [Sphingobium sufflavum]MCE7798835.1 PAS domain S-box protein [Sphingobium sufflavum]
MTNSGLPGGAEAKFKLLVDAVTDYALYMLDPEGRITTWNSGAQKAKGYTADEIVGQHFSCFFTPEDRSSALPQRALHVAAAEGRFEAEGWRIRKDGTRFFANSIIDPIRNEAGELMGFAKISRDITERRERELALFEAEQRFRLLVQGVKDCAIYMLDTDGFITNWNTGAAAIKGYSSDEVVGEHFSIFYTDDDRVGGAPERALATALAEGKYETEAWRVRKDGSLFWANVLIDPIHDEGGKHVGFAKVTRDATDKRRAQEELEETRSALLQAQKLQAIGELTGGVAHDFNNLLTVIGGAAEMLRKADLAEEKRVRYLDNISKMVERASTLTSHLLAFSRRRAIRPEVIDLNIHLDAWGEVLSRSLGSAITLAVKASAKNACVEVDPTELETAVLNAAVNARDAMPEGGQLLIETRDVVHEGHAAVAIDITDTGGGMSEETIARVFEPFFTTKPIGEGTGLGLSQIHGFAAQAGGIAQISSRIGLGTTLAIILPRVDKEPAVKEREGELASIPSGLRVLLVEDNIQVLQFAEQLLNDLGCQTVCATDATRALALIQERSFDLVFSDIVMPGLTGIDLARQLHIRAPELPVLLATGYSEQLVGEGQPHLRVLAKPYGAETLSAAIRELITTSAISAERNF